MQQPIVIVNQEIVNELPKDLYIPPDALQICLDMFEGPLDLLLYLIRKQNLDILSIPIAIITDQYIQYINAMQELNIDLASEYLLMAAMLLEIKSRMLLPRKIAENIVDDVDVESDPRQELIKKLIEYEQMKVAAVNLNQLPQANRDYLWLDVFIDSKNILPPQIKGTDLQKAWHNILLKSMQVRQEHHIKRQELSVREYMSHILKYLSVHIKSSFYALFDVESGVAHVVVNFIAILELTKEGLIELLQGEDSEITVAICGG